jgi:catechol 2,3-dioxygenase-like lactoylglutathione lyase family enzyme
MLALADVAIVVRNAKASAKWWKRHLGFESYTIGGVRGHAVLVAPPGERFVLHLCEGFAPLEPGDTGIAFVTDEIEPLMARMRRARIQFPAPLKTETWGGRAKFADPDGNVFWLLSVPTQMVRATLNSRAPPSSHAKPMAKRSRSPSARRRPKSA